MKVSWTARELRNNIRLSVLFVVNLTIGLVGFVVLDSFKTSLKNELDINSKSILSADLSISSRRELKNEEIEQARAILGDERKESHSLEFFSMIDSSQGSRLVQVKAIDENYPLYGQLKLQSGEQHKTYELNQSYSAWTYPELGFKVGEKLKLGDS